MRDSIQCFTLAIENPPENGEYRVFNQFEETYQIDDLAKMVKSVSNKLGLNAKIKHVENPRVEKEEHYFNAKNTNLIDLGLKPLKLSDILDNMAEELKENNPYVNLNFIKPKITWKK